MTDTKLLMKAIERSGLKREAIANKLGITRAALQKKTSGENEFKASEVVKLTGILQLSTKERDLIFLTEA